MDNIFQYAFMQRAFVVAAIIAVIAPCIGVSIVLKRLSAIGDATSHSALAGIAFGLLLGINPILGAVMFSIFAVSSACRKSRWASALIGLSVDRSPRVNQRLQ